MIPSPPHNLQLSDSTRLSVPSQEEQSGFSHEHGVNLPVHTLPHLPHLNTSFPLTVSFLWQ